MDWNTKQHLALIDSGLHSPDLIRDQTVSQTDMYYDLNNLDAHVAADFGVATDDAGADTHAVDFANPVTVSNH